MYVRWGLLCQRSGDGEGYAGGDAVGRGGRVPSRGVPRKRGMGASPARGSGAQQAAALQRIVGASQQAGIHQYHLHGAVDEVEEAGCMGLGSS